MEKGAASRLSVKETLSPPLPQRLPATSRGGTCTCLGTRTVGLVAVGGLNADEDVLVQQVLGVRDNGLQL